MHQNRKKESLGVNTFHSAVHLKSSFNCLPYLLTAANWRGAQVEINCKRKPTPGVCVCVLQQSVKVMLDQEKYTVLSFSFLQIFGDYPCSPSPPLLSV